MNWVRTCVFEAGARLGCSELKLPTGFYLARSFQCSLTVGADISLLSFSFVKIFLQCAQMNSPLEISVPGQNHFSVFSLDHLTDVPPCPLAAG